MRWILSFSNWVVTLAYFAGAVVVTLFAVGAALGFVHPALDFFNHLQPFLLAGTLLCILCARVFVHAPRMRALIVAISATGLLASALIVVPDAAARLVPRAPLPADDRPVYRLMTHNLFGLNYQTERVANNIALENPDVITLQEYFQEQRDGLHPLLLEEYPHFSVCQGGKRANVAIYAKFPFEAKIGGACEEDDAGDHRVSRISAQFYFDDGTQFTVMTTHMDWPLQISKLDDGEDIGQGLDLSVARQSGQFEFLADAINSTANPVLLAADFNSTPWSYALRAFQQATGMHRHTRSLLTFPSRFFIFGWRDTVAFLPLDHVMTRGNVDVHSVRTGDPAGSDHKPVITTFSINKSDQAQ